MRLRTRIIVSIAIGIVATVGVAWVVLPFTNVLHDDYMGERDENGWDVPLGRFHWFHTQSPPASWMVPPFPRDRDDLDGWHVCLAMGWPQQALCSDYAQADRNSDLGGSIRLSGGIRLGGVWRRIPGHDLGGLDRTLPTRPIWSGVAIDTAFYGMITFALLSVPATRRALRRRRGLCAACAYPVTEGTCPECGAAVTR